MTRPGFSTGESSKGNEMASLVQDILDMSSFRLLIKELDLGLVDKIFVTTDGVVAEIPREAIHYAHTPQGEYVLFGDFCSIGEHEIDLMLTDRSEEDTSELQSLMSNSYLHTISLHGALPIWVNPQREIKWPVSFKLSSTCRAFGCSSKNSTSASSIRFS